MLTWLSRLWQGRRSEPDHLVLGRWGERQAERFLRREGLSILGRRVRVGPKAELDLVAREGKETLVFVEVKTRVSEKHGRPVDAVTARKKRMLVRAGKQYLNTLRPRPVYWRYDVVEVVGHPDASKPPMLRHIKGAFSGERS